MFDPVRFSPAVIEDGGRAGVSFFASVDSSPVHCSITAHTLEVYFGADPMALEAAFRAHRSEIEEVAVTLINTRGIRSGHLHIDVGDLQSSLLAFGRSVRPSSLLPDRPPPEE